MDDRPNIIIIYTDQQRYDTLGVNGNDLIKTPNLDRLANEGVHFTRGYCSTPICVPSRVALFTGRYNHTNLSYNNGLLLRDEETEMTGYLKSNGYQTALIGKDHCFEGPRREDAFDFVWQASHNGFKDPQNASQERVNEVREGKMQLPYAEDPVPPEENVTGSLFRTAREYIDSHRDKPFFMWLSIPDPHPPYMVCEPYASMYVGVDIPPPAWREGEMADKPYCQQAVVRWDRCGKEYPGDEIDKLRRLYWGMVSYIDTEAGKLLDFLRENKLDENTIIVYTTDHGDYMGDHRMIRKGPHVYEALVHVPLIVRWSGHLKARSTSAMASNIDIFPTLLDLVDLPHPERLQGRSFAPVLLGDSDAHRERVFFEHGVAGEPLQSGDLSPEENEELGEDTGHHLCDEVMRGRTKGVRSDRWKYVITPGDVDELYDLDDDPNELTNLAADPKHQEVVQEHRQYLLEWLVETEDTYPPANAD